MTTTGRSLRAAFLRFDDALASKGVPPLTAWWREHVGGWLDAYESDGVLDFVACCGRGAAKSTSLYRLAAFFTLFGSFTVPPGETHYAIVLSRLREEAAKGIAIIARWFTLLGVRYRLAGDVIELADLPRGIRVAAASVAAVSGWRAFFVGKDERSKWPTGGVDELDAEEVDTSATAMTATHPKAPTVSVGSAWGAFGGFYQAVTEGSTASRYVAGPAATWEVAPHVTRADCERKERDPRKFAREYMCVFSAGGAGTFDVDQIDRAIRTIDRPHEQLGPAVLVTDSSAGRGDAWTWCRAAWCREIVDEEDRYLWRSAVLADGTVAARHAAPVYDENGDHARNPDFREPRAFLRIDMLGAFEGHFAEEVDADRVVDHLAALARQGRAQAVIGDGYQRFFLAAGLARHRLGYIALDWSSGSKASSVARLKQVLREDRVIIHPGEEARKLRRELIEFQERILPSGIVGYGARRGGHDDRVALLLNAAMADVEGILHGSPLRRPRERFDVTRPALIE